MAAALFGEHGNLRLEFAGALRELLQIREQQYAFLRRRAFADQQCLLVANGRVYVVEGALAPGDLLSIVSRWKAASVRPEQASAATDSSASLIVTFDSCSDTVPVTELSSTRLKPPWRDKSRRSERRS